MSTGAQTWGFKDFSVGQVFETDFELTAERVAEYVEVQGYSSSLFKDPEQAALLGLPGLPAPPGLATTYQFIAAVPGLKLPPGGFYAKQEFQMHRPCCVGDSLHTVITVAEKYERRGHRYIVFESVTTNGSSELVIWGRRTRAWPE